MDGVSISSNVESPQVLDNDDSLKLEGAEESKGKSVKSTDANHFEVSTKLRILYFFPTESQDISNSTLEFKFF